MSARRVFWVAALAWLVSWSGSVTAQAEADATTGAEAQPGMSGDARQLARERYDRGVQAASEGRWADAVDAFRDSQRLLRNPATLYNLGTALRALGRHVETRDVLDELLGFADLDPAIAEPARAMRTEAAARVATIRIDLHTRLPGLRLSLDDALVPPDRAALEVDPGRHTVRAEAPSHESFRWSSIVEPGGVLDVAIRLQPRRRSPVAKILGLSAALVVVVAGLAVGLALRDDPLRGQSADVIRL